MKRSVQLASILAGTALALAAPLLVPSVAQACGGNFCDVSGPANTPVMPVDQTGENIAFHIGDGYVEAHIQIQIDPDSGAESFAWLIPVSAVPEFEVGSQLMFDALLAGSVPSYGMTTTTDFCGEEDEIGEGESGGPLDSGGSEDGWGDEGGDEGGQDEIDVVFQGSVGTFDLAVLDGDSVASIMQWLGDNGYQQDPNAEPILAQYLEEGFLFAAMKLSADTGLSDIHPIVIRYPGTEACLPLRLTAIAAAENMDIRTFFLQEARTVPVNYRHVQVNPLKLDWLDSAANYREVITMAVDAGGADGNAFVTEYAGSTAVIDTSAVFSKFWDADLFVGYVDSPVEVVHILDVQGLMSCHPEQSAECNYNHPLVEGILDQFIPVPVDVDAVDFYACLECYVEDIDLESWDAAAFSAMLDERVVQPGLAASTLIRDNAYLTRMYTTISAAEMGEDPMFRVNDTLPDVPATRVAQQTNHCDGSATVTLPDGREVLFPEQIDMTWPEFDEQMPWEEEVDQENMAKNAPLISLVDNTEAIDAMLKNHNNSARRKIPGLPSGGCSCSMDPEDRPPGGALFGLLALGLFGLVRRRGQA